MPLKGLNVQLERPAARRSLRVEARNQQHEPACKRWRRRRFQVTSLVDCRRITNNCLARVNNFWNFPANAGIIHGPGHRSIELWEATAFKFRACVEFANAQAGTRSCSSDCSSQGICLAGKCLCRQGFYGQSCALLEYGYVCKILPA